MKDENVTLADVPAYVFEPPSAPLARLKYLLTVIELRAQGLALLNEAFELELFGRPRRPAPRAPRGRGLSGLPPGH